MTDRQLATHEALNQAYISKNNHITDRVEAIVSPHEEALPTELEELLNSIKDTPIDEPELYAILQNDDGRLLGFTKALGESIDLDAYDALTASEFIARARMKIISKTDKDGIFKSTPKLDTVKLPKLSVIRALSEAWTNETPIDEITRSAVATTGITDLSKWEQELIGLMFMRYTTAYANTSMGEGVSDRTPFARYLKNG